MNGPGFPFFGGANIHQMNVNFNFAGQNGMMPNPMSLGGPFMPANNLLDNERVNPNAIGYQEQPETVDAVVVEDTVKVSLKFNKCHIDKDFKIHFDKSFDFDGNRPKSKIENMNPHYRVRTDLPAYHNKYDDEVFSDIEIRDKLPIILTMVNIDHLEEEEDKVIIDQILFHATLLSVISEQKSFFLILEETGSTGFGEPILSHINGKGIFHQTVYSVTIPENFSKKK